MSKLLYRIDEVMEILAISRRTVYRLIEEGDLVSHNNNPGNKGMRITADSIEAYAVKYRAE